MRIDKGMYNVLHVEHENEAIPKHQNLLPTLRCTTIRPDSATAHFAISDRPPTHVHKARIRTT